MKHPKLNRLLRRVLTLALSAAALSGAAGWRALAPAAEAVDLQIDGSGFTNPRITTGYMYHWRRGMPPNEQKAEEFLASGGEPVKYPILMTWDGKYYLNTGTSFANRFTERYTKKELIEQYLVGGGTLSSSDLNRSQALLAGYEELNETRDGDGYRIKMDKSGLLANVFFYQDLKTNGETVCMDVGMPTVPYVVPARRSFEREYILGTPRVAGGALDYDENWLTPQVYCWTAAWNGSEERDWGLGALHMDAKTLLSSKVVYNYDPAQATSNPAGEASYTNPITMDYLRDEMLRLNPALAADTQFASDFKFGPNEQKFTLRNATWDIWNGGDAESRDYVVYGHSGLYAYMITERGFNVASWERDGKLLNRAQQQMFHDKGKLVVEDADGGYEYNNSKYKFEFFYAEPVITSFMQTSFTVQKGQVVSLDGPIVIGPGCVVTVEDGGVLSCSGWIINNGQILVKPGGTMLVQEQKTAADHAYGVVNSYGADSDSASGRIACDGTMIVMRDCKVVGGGLYGLQLGEGAQVVNYGQVIAENLDVYARNTIENRGGDSAVFAGWGLTDSGYELTLNQITEQTWSGKGTVQKTALVKMPQGAVYGAGADRVYVNTGLPAGGVSLLPMNSTVTVERAAAPRRGYVTGFVASIAIAEDAPVEALPDTIPIYYDQSYDVYYVEAGGTVYHYDAAVGRWVYIAPDGSHSIYDYGLRPTDSGYDYHGQLPSDYVLSDGRIAYPSGTEPAAQQEGLHYDVHQRVFWFEADSGSDAPYYYWEQALQRWVYVDQHNKYLLGDAALSPPPDLSADYISSSMWQDVPSGFQRYSAGMQESTGETAAYDPSEAPKVQYDPNSYPYYYILYDNGYGEGVQKYWWDENNKVFSLVGDRGFYGRTVDPEKADLNGFTLPGYLVPQTAPIQAPAETPPPTGSDGVYKPDPFFYDSVYGFVYFEYGGKVYYNEPRTDNWVYVSEHGDLEPFAQPVDSSVLPKATIKSMPKGTRFYYYGKLITVP